MLRHKERTEPEDLVVEDRDGRVYDPRLVDDDGHERVADYPPPPARAEEVTTVRAFSIGQVLIMAAGAAMLAMGIVTIVRGDLDGELTDPVVQVLGFDHTPLLGLIEIGAGVLLVLAGLRPSGRMLAGLIGALLIVAGALVLAELDWITDNLTAEQSYGWVPIIVGAVTLVAAFAFPTKVRQVREIR
jgi:hypothetical protein